MPSNQDFDESDNLRKFDRKIERAYIEWEPRNLKDFLKNPIHPNSLEDGKDFFDRPGAKPNERTKARGCGYMAVILGILISVTGLFFGGYGLILTFSGAFLASFGAMAIFGSYPEKKIGCDEETPSIVPENNTDLPPLIDLEQQYHGASLAEMTMHHFEKMPLEILIKAEIGTATLLPPEIGLEEVEVWVDEIRALATSEFFWQQDCGEAFRILTNLAKKYFDRKLVMRNDEDLFNMFQIFMMNYAVSCYQFTNNLEPLVAALKWNEKKSLKIRKEIGKSRILASKDINILILEEKRKLIAENIKKQTSESDIGAFNEKLLQSSKSSLSILEIISHEQDAEILSKIASVERDYCENSGDFMQAARSTLTLYEKVSANVIIKPISENFDSLGKMVIEVLDSKKVNTDKIENVLLKETRATLGPVTYVLQALNIGLKMQNQEIEGLCVNLWGRWFAQKILRRNISGYFHKITKLRNKLSHNLDPVSEEEYSELLRESFGKERFSSWLTKKYNLRNLEEKDNSGYLESLILAGSLRI